MEYPSSFVEISKEWQKMSAMRLIDVIEKEGAIRREDA
jgi:hypothetical protein